MTSNPEIVFAIAAAAETAAAAAHLVDGLRQFHPGASILALSIDGTDLPFDVDRAVGPDDLRAPTTEIRRRIDRSSPADAAMAMLPEVGVLALADHRSVILVDPAIEVVGPLDAIQPVADEALRLVPRSLRPPPVDGRHPDIGEIHELGVYLPTLLGAGRRGIDILTWWSRETARSPSNRGRLLDLATSAASTSVCRSPGHGVGFARIGPASRFVRSAGSLELDGAPVASIDTTPRSPAAPHLLAPTGGLRARFSDHPALAEVLDRRDLAIGPGSDATPADGRTRLYAEALKRHELADHPQPPPLHSAEFDDWLAQPESRIGGLPRVAMGLWRLRLDVREPFPDPDRAPEDRREFLDWLRRDGFGQEGLDPALLDATPEPAPAEDIVPGVDLAGFVDADLGVGEIARLVQAGLDGLELPVAVQTLGGTANRRQDRLIPADDGPRHPIEILCVNADRISSVVRGRRRPDEVHTIGVFFWETDVATDAMREGIAAVDEIWTGSHYCADLFSGWTDRPVHVLPVPVVVPEPEGDPATLLAVEPGRPVVLTAIDFHSVVARKNPDGLIEAFRRAVPAGDGPALVIKSINGDRVPDELERLRWQTRDRRDISVIDGYVRPGELSAMIRDASVYASLHRSEGFGLTIAHAMALGTPVVCTEGSGPADFVDPAVAHVVAATITEVGPGADPYPAVGRWWDPDLDDAAASIASILDDPAAAGVRAEAAATAISRRDMATTTEFLRSRLAGSARRRGWWKR